MHDTSPTSFSGWYVERKPVPQRSFQDEVRAFIDALEACLADFPCSDAFARKREYILAEHGKLETAVLRAQSHLGEQKEILSSQTATITRLRDINSVLSSRLGTTTERLEEERAENLTLRQEVALKEDAVLSLTKQLGFQTAEANVPSSFQLYF